MPNIVFVLTDDQRQDNMSVMTNVRTLLAERGMTFMNAFVVNPLCCPSRTSILSGQYSHSTGIYQDSANRFDSSSTIATWLDGAGYHTGMVGKYANGWALGPVQGWDRWNAFAGGERYYNYRLNEDGVVTEYGSGPENYSTDVLGAKAEAFIREAPKNDPLFLWFAPNAPHSPATPADRHKDDLSDILPHRPPNYNEEDVSDKPAWVQALPLMTPEKQASKDQRNLSRLRALLAVDEWVGALVTALEETGRLTDTMIVFSSDNGLAWGEHRWHEKQNPYEEVIRVPMVVRYDPMLPTATSDPHLVLNIDLAPTWAALAGVAAPDVEGMSFLPLLTDPAAPWRTDFLVEHIQNKSSHPPIFCEVRSETFSYVAYDTGEQELYDLALDPYQLENRALDPAYAATLAAMQVRVLELCQPLPPGWGS